MRNLLGALQARPEHYYFQGSHMLTIFPVQGPTTKDASSLFRQGSCFNMQCMPDTARIDRQKLPFRAREPYSRKPPVLRDLDWCAFAFMTRLRGGIEGA